NPLMYFGAEDIPVFYHYSVKHLRNFKIIYWLKSLLMVPEFQNKSFEEIEIPEEILKLAEEIFNSFTLLNSIEVWTHETVLSTIKQIRFYWEAGFFKNNESVQDVLKDLETTLNSIQR